MKVYIAAPYPARDMVAQYAAEMAPDWECTSSWANGKRPITEGTVGPTNDVDLETVTQHASGDFDDIDRADALIILTGAWVKERLEQPVPDNWLHTGGRHVEVGFALATGKPVVVVGEPENVFQRGLCLNAYDVQSAMQVLDEFARPI